MDITRKKVIIFLNRFGKQLIVGLVVLLISIVFPARQKFQYEFQKGQRWNYETLFAPFDFPVKKSEQQMAQDRSSLIKDFIPYYRYLPKVPTARWFEFESSVNTWLRSVRNDFLRAFSEADRQAIIEQSRTIFDRIYDKGVAERDPAHQTRGPDFVINVVKGNELQPRILEKIRTPVEAGQAALALFDSLQALDTPLPPRSLFSQLFVPNIVFDVQLTQKLQDEALTQLVTTSGVVRKGDVIVTRSAIISENTYEILVSFQKEFEQEYGPSSGATWVYLGYLILTLLVFLSFLMYVRVYRREILERWSYLISVLIWPVIFIFLTFLVEQSRSLSVFILPYCIVPIIMRHFFTYRLAFFVHVLVVLLCSLLTSVSYQFVFLQILAGVVAVLAVTDARYWSRFFMSVLFITLTYFMGFFAMELVREGNLTSVNYQMFGWLLGNSVLVMLAFPLIPLMERSFGFVSSISLVELSDTNRPLLKLLALKAPGTFQHSIQVAHLCEAAASEIGADSLLVRVAALYHDVGKTLRPEFFVENQRKFNPHTGLGCIESARIIIDHVPQGAEVARKYKLPQVIIDFILTHHGTTRTEFFYKTWIKENPDQAIDPAIFTYSGPIPRTKEEGILMLADSIEATLRSVIEPSPEEIDEVVDSIFREKLKQGQFDSCILSIKELEQCRRVIKTRLHSIYSMRIKYPE